jgi:hypothetical protein
MRTNPDGVTKTADVAHPGAYPLVKVDYGMVPTRGITPAKAGHIGQFLDFVASTGQVPPHLPPGYVPLPQELRAQDAEARELVLRGAQPPPPVPPSGGPLPADAGTVNAFDAPSSSASEGSTADITPASPETGPSSQPANQTQLASNARPVTNDSVLQALRDFLGGDHHLLLPVILVLGGAALAAGPMLILKSQGRLHRPRRRRREAKASPA